MEPNKTLESHIRRKHAPLPFPPPRPSTSTSSAAPAFFPPPFCRKQTESKGDLCVCDFCPSPRRASSRQCNDHLNGNGSFNSRLRSCFPSSLLPLVILPSPGEPRHSRTSSHCRGLFIFVFFFLTPRSAFPVALQKRGGTHGVRNNASSSSSSSVALRKPLKEPYSWDCNVMSGPLKQKA